MKSQPTELEKIFANNETDKGLISKIYKQFIQLNNNKNLDTDNKPFLKMSSKQKKDKAMNLLEYNIGEKSR